MFLEERQQEICALIEQDGRVAVNDLAARFGVTEDCIRKDLKQLSRAGRCNRVYGGATRIEPADDYEVRSRIGAFDAEKQLIAEKAIRLIEPRQTIFLDISTTNLHLARLIGRADIPCTVVSPMVDILAEAAKSSCVEAICPGGTMHLELNGFVGALALEALERFRFDVAFVGAYGIDLDEYQAATFNADDGLLKRAAIERATRSYLVCETRKFNARGNFRFASLDDITALICNTTEGEELDRARRAGLEVI